MPDRLLGAVFISVGYLEPGLVWDIESFNKLSREAFGYETYGYWLWHNTEEAVKDCEDHPASVFNLLYPSDPADWKQHFAPVGKAAEFVRGGRLGPLPSWYPLDEYTMRDRIMAMKGYRGPLNWYKAGVRSVNIPDEASVAEGDRECRVPTLLVVSEQDYVTRADAQSENTKKWAKDLRIKTLDCGHWIQLERPTELQNLLEEFAAEVAI
ncbi:hypothetical protein QQX98_007653 [Neonectria punicea]|uniref:AB hydrolase-1 domain-containing protein n=1 Tax=Neonectria punicea TaxID=979145 RepID=A0ABR1GXF2_9HYPO